jgi:hypothetical protein
MKIQYVKGGIGNNFGEVIELNEDLKKYPKLHDSIVSHELRHTKNLMSKQDFVADMAETKIDKKELLLFMLKHPRSFSQFLPLYYNKRWGLVYDLNLFLSYGVILCCIALAWLLAIFVF